MVGVDADVLLLGAEGELAAVQGLELVVRLQVGPAPHAAVDDVGQALPVGHLKPAVQRAGDGHALTCGGGVGGTAGQNTNVKGQPETLRVMLLIDMHWMLHV